MINTFVIKPYVVTGMITVALLIAAGFVYQNTVSEKTIMAKTSSQLSALPQQIVAPAIVDAVKDVAHVTTVQSGIVREVRVKTNSFVKKGDPLILLDASVAKNYLQTQQNLYHQAMNAVVIQQKLLSAAIERLARANRIDPRAISKNEKNDRKHDVEMNKLQLAQLQLGLANAELNLKNAERNLNDSIITAPIDGIVLQINTRQDEFVGGGQTLVLLGDANKVFVRVSIDERDLHHFRQNAHAVITSLDGSDITIPITFSELDHYIVVPENLNTRCIEAKYYFKRADYPGIVAGQQFEATITLPATG